MSPKLAAENRNQRILVHDRLKTVVRPITLFKTQHFQIDPPLLNPHTAHPATRLVRRALSNQPDAFCGREY